MNDDWGYGLDVDASNNVLLSGHITNTVDFDPSASVSNQVAILGSSFFIAKYNNASIYNWAITSRDIVAGSWQGENSYSVKTDGTGNVFMCGSFRGEVDFDPSPSEAYLISTPVSNIWNPDIFLAKYDNSGNFLWVKGFGDAQYDEAKTMAVDAMGNVYIAGYYYGIVDFDPGPGTSTLTTNTNYNGFIAKYDANGNYLWVIDIDGSGVNDFVNFISLDAGGNIYATGQFAGTVDFDPSVATATLSSLGSNNDVFLAKYDQNGNYLWAGVIGNSSNADAGTALALDNFNNIYLSGLFSGIVDFDFSPGTTTLSSVPGSSNMFLAKYSSNGNFLWADGFDAPSFNNDIINSVAIATSGNVYVTGSIDVITDFDPSPTTTVNLGASPGMFVAKYDKNGNYKWAKDIPSAEGKSLVLDGNDNIFISGDSGFGADFNPGPATNTVTFFGSTDIFIAKYDSLGNYIWAGSMGGNGYDYGNSIHLSGNNLFLTGTYYYQSDFDPSVSVAYLNSLHTSTYQCMFLAKYGPCPLATSTVGALSNVLCFGGSSGSATIIPTGGTSYTYSWTPSVSTGSIASGLSIGTYTCQLTNQCGYSATSTFTITEPATSVTVAAVTSNTLICSGYSSTLTASGSGGTGSLSYTWAPSGNGQIINVTPTITTVFTVTGTDTNGCTANAMVTQSVSPCTNILNKILSEVSAFPNPTNSQFNLVFNSIKQKAELKIFNSIGQIVLGKNIFSTDRVSLNLSDQPSGIYFVEVNVDGEVYREKVVKE